MFWEEREIDLAIINALQMCEKQGITGKNVTPFVLSEVSRVTKGVSMETSMKRKLHLICLHLYHIKCFIILDISLLKNNSLIGSKIAVEYYSKRSPNGTKSGFEIKKDIKKTRKSPVRKKKKCYSMFEVSLINHTLILIVIMYN